MAHKNPYSELQRKSESIWKYRPEKMRYRCWELVRKYLFGESGFSPEEYCEVLGWPSWLQDYFACGVALILEDPNYAPFLVRDLERRKLFLATLMLQRAKENIRGQDEM